MACSSCQKNSQPVINRPKVVVTNQPTITPQVQKPVQPASPKFQNPVVLTPSLK